MKALDRKRHRLFNRLLRGSAGDSKSAKRVGGVFAVLALSAGIGLALSGPSVQAANQESEELGTQPSAVQEAADENPAARRLLEIRDERQRRLLAWWDYTREALLASIELSPEQARHVDALIEVQLETRTQLEDLDTEIRIALEKGDRELSRKLREQRRDLATHVKERHELMEEVRAVLTVDQHPVFDMNRARLVAEGQKSRKPREAQ